MPPTWSILTPANARGAIGIVQLRAHDAVELDTLLGLAGVRSRTGRPVLTDLLGVDEGIAVRWDGTTIDLFCHGGPAVLRGLVGAVENLGAVRAPGAVYTEANSPIESAMLAALARAASPLAVDLLLDQPRRWGGEAGEALPTRTDGVAVARPLARLIDPPLVVAVGPANVGKSTLLNALAGRGLSIVADQPGTTRDHVGATLDLGGLVVRYLDTPGLLADAAGVDRDAIDLARAAAESADLVLACGDPASEPPAEADLPAGADVLRVCLRHDLGEPAWPADALVSVRTGRGVAELARAIRDRLVPPAALADPRPWRFWDGQPAAV